MGTLLVGLVAIRVINGLVPIITLLSPMVELCFHVWHWTWTFIILSLWERTLDNMMESTTICIVNIRFSVNSMSIVNNAGIFSE